MGGGRQGAEGAGEEGAGYLVRGRPAPLPLPTAPTMRGRQAAPAPFPPPPGGRPRPPLLGVYDIACCMAWYGSMLALQCQVRLFKLQHSLAPSRVRNPHAMRVRSVVGCARGPDGLAGYGCASPAAIVHQVFFASNKYVGL